MTRFAPFPRLSAACAVLLVLAASGALAETPAPRPNPARVCVAPLGSADAAPVGRPALGCGARYALSEILGAPGAASVLVEAEASDLAPARPRDMSLGF